MTTEPIYLYAPYQDQPWFYVEPHDHTQHPGASPYYQGTYVKALQDQLAEKEKQLQKLAGRAADLIEGLEDKVLPNALPARLRKLRDEVMKAQGVSEI